jgi:hypothetical protein
VLQLTWCLLSLLLPSHFSELCEHVQFELLHRLIGCGLPKQDNCPAAIVKDNSLRGTVFATRYYRTILALPPTIIRRDRRLESASKATKGHEGPVHDGEQFPVQLG